MKLKIFFSFIAILFTFFVSKSQTTIPANTQVSGTWTKSNGPYYVKGNVSVPSGSTLVIEPGVQVRFDGKYMMAVYGKIKAIGKLGDTIRFFPQDTMNRWRGIRYLGTSNVDDSALFAYCKFEYAGPKVTNDESALKMTRGHFRVNHCVFKNNSSVLNANSIRTDSILSLEISNSYFYKNRNVNTNSAISDQVIGVVFITGGIIKNCMFEENVSKNPYNSMDEYQVNGYGSGSTILFSDYYLPNSKFEITGCKFIRNNCAELGAGVNLGGIVNNSNVKIKNCSFVDNRTGRYGCITYVGSNSNTKGNAKVTIDSCYFGNNISSNTTVADGVSCITFILFKSYDSLFIRNNVFENNTGRSTVSMGTPNDGRQYLIGNIFRGNSIWCLDAQDAGEVWSINNIYHNNMSMNLSEILSVDFQLRSINDAYLFNGPNIDTFALDQRMKGTYKGEFFKFTGANEIIGGGGGTFKNCIFWGNRNYFNQPTHINVQSGKMSEISNCIFEGNPDSAILWSDYFNPTRPNPIVLKYENNFNKNPLFVNPPTTYGPNGLKPDLDFHLINNCSQLSPAHNAGSNAALTSWTNINDFDGHTRIVCDTIDIGPYEIGPTYKKVKITKTPQDAQVCDNELQLSINTTCNLNQSYQWQYKQGQNWINLNPSNTANYLNTHPQAGAYRVIYTQTDCNTSDTSKAINITLKPSPKPFIGRDTTIEQKSSLILDAGQYGAYKWQNNSTSRTFTINGTTQGISKKTYHVRVTGSNGCYGYDTISVNVTWNSSLESLLSQGWQLYPNPAGQTLYLQSPNQATYQWQLINQLGQTLLEGQSTEDGQINLSDIPTGVYFLKVQTQQGISTLRVVKE
ncbi:MAG TPA: T9SS type A sorting domain-containing protein [Bacteroidia bacterium]